MPLSINFSVIPIIPYVARPFAKVFNAILCTIPSWDLVTNILKTAFQFPLPFVTVGILIYFPTLPNTNPSMAPLTPLFNVSPKSFPIVYPLFFVYPFSLNNLLKPFVTNVSVAPPAAPATAPPAIAPCGVAINAPCTNPPATLPTCFSHGLKVSLPFL